MSKDDGFYECQVNTRDKMSLVFKLNVQREFNIFFVSLDITLKEIV